MKAKIFVLCCKLNKCLNKFKKNTSNIIRLMNMNAIQPVFKFAPPIIILKSYKYYILKYIKKYAYVYGVSNMCLIRS